MFPCTSAYSDGEDRTNTQAIEMNDRYTLASSLVGVFFLNLALLTMLLRSRRNRRREDNYGVNLFILAGISMLSLFTLNVSVA